MSLLPLKVEAAIFYAAFLAWLFITFVVEPWFIGRGGRKERDTSEDGGSALLIFGGTFAAIVVAFSLGGAEVTPLPEWTFFAGVAVMFVGVAVREWAVATLKGFFLFRVGVLKEHRVVDTGPYRLVRHPGYSGAMLTFAGIGLATESLVGVLIMVLICSVVYGYRIRVEEKALQKDLGEEYQAYMRRTKRLVPYVL